MEVLNWPCGISKCVWVGKVFWSSRDYRRYSGHESLELKAVPFITSFLKRKCCRILISQKKKRKCRRILMLTCIVSMWKIIIKNKNQIFPMGASNIPWINIFFGWNKSFNQSYECRGWHWNWSRTTKLLGIQQRRQWHRTDPHIYSSYNLLDSKEKRGYQILILTHCGLHIMWRAWPNWSE